MSQIYKLQGCRGPTPRLVTPRKKQRGLVEGTNESSDFYWLSFFGRFDFVTAKGLQACGYAYQGFRVKRAIGMMIS